MANKKLTPQQNDQPTQPGKKLQKQRQRILKDLEAAQQAQADALERFHRAESRLQRRTAELQRVAAELLFIQQQLGEPTGSVPLAVAMPSGERARTLEEPSIVESTVHAQTADANTSGEQPPTVAQQTAEPSLSTQTSSSTSEPGQELPTTTQRTIQVSEVPTVTERTEDTLSTSTQLPEEPAQSPNPISEADEEIPAATQHTEEPPTSTPPSTSTTDLTEEEFPAATQHTVQELPTPIPSNESTSVGTSAELEEQRRSPGDCVSIPRPSTLDRPAEQSIELPIQPIDTSPTLPDPTSHAEAFEHARQARAVAEAAEQAARQAAERAAAAAAHLDQLGSGSRHLLHELDQLQTEAERAEVHAQAANLTAEQAEARAAALQPPTPDPDDVVGTQSIAPTNMEEPTSESDPVLNVVGADLSRPSPIDRPTDPGDVVGTQFIVSEGEEKQPGATQITDPDDDELPPASNTATMIAGAAAAAAAQAEAIAEDSRARTREARRFAQQADQVLKDARASIQNGLWSGEDAEQYLQTLEIEATRAHTLLADAEAAEADLQRAANNAEIEAESAESLAFTNNDSQANQNDTQ